jgi:class 3 adenylate cyclase
VAGAGPADPMNELPHRSAPNAAGGARPSTRGFLFADLRDYTAFVDSRGDHAAAELLDRYRAMVRDAVASFAGAEIRTEGDSFYVVFDSASAAVGCGLAIIAAAGAAAAQPDPIHVGVGVHAGETVETGEGYVGAAVNIAARLCSQAKAGELIVSDTVRALTRTYLDVTFEPLGARRLKGLEEPIAIYRVVPAATPGAARPRIRRRSRPRRMWWLAGIAAVALVVVLLIALVAVTAAIGPGASSSPTGAPGSAAGSSLGDAPSASPSSVAATAAIGSPPAASASGGLAGLSPAEQELLARIPREFQPFCRRSSLPDGSLGGDAASLRCDLPLGTAAVFGADTVWYDAFPAPGLMSTAVNGVASRQRLPLVEGDAAGMADACTSGSGSGIGRWSLGITFAGQLACYAKDGSAWILWTYEGQQIAARAVRRDGDAARLYDWWQEQASGFLR